MKIAIVWTSINQGAQLDFFNLSFKSFINSNNYIESFIFTENKTEIALGRLNKLGGGIKIIDFDDIGLTLEERFFLTEYPLVSWTILPACDIFEEYDYLIFLDNDTIINTDLSLLVKKIIKSHCNENDEITVRATSSLRMRYMKSTGSEFLGSIISGLKHINSERFFESDLNPVRRYKRLYQFRFYLFNRHINDQDVIAKLLEEKLQFRPNGGFWLIKLDKYKEKFPNYKDVMKFHYKTKAFFKESNLKNWYISDEDFIFLNFNENTEIFDHNFFKFNLLLKENVFKGKLLLDYNMLHFADYDTKQIIIRIFDILKENPNKEFSLIINELKEMEEFKYLLRTNDLKLMGAYSRDELDDLYINRNRNSVPLEEFLNYIYDLFNEF